MKKNLVTYGLVALLIASSTCFGFAQSKDLDSKQINTEVIDLSNTLTSRQIYELKNTVNASMVSEDGTQIPLDVVLEVKELTKQRSANGAKTYSIKASTQKTVSDTSDRNKDGVNASAHITMVWTDVSGTKNTIDRLSGGVKIIKGTRTGSKVEWGKGSQDIAGRETVKGDSFSVKPNYTTDSNLGTVYGCYIIHFEETTNFLQVNVIPWV